MALLEIRNLHARVGGKDILKGLDLVIEAGSVHAVMGPNGAGKSTLSNVIAGRPGYEIIQGEVLLDGQNLLEMEADARARLGVFMAFQYPVEIPGVATTTFLRHAYNAKRRQQGLGDVDAMQFLKLVRAKTKELGISDDKLKRPLNVGFSGGEKKRGEVLQMAVLEPRLAILDEMDSGLDIDALRICAEGVNRLRSPERGFLVITHYQRLLDYIVPDVVHVLAGGRIVKTGDKALALELEKSGYAVYGEEGGA
ncbi:MAG: Fe-S cluster assembly ATPase SufC [Alphaproteobacteria bacterium RIFOXYD12_FULL_60_8]|nr:MAG: Fe-S cluster assembly ATPase SufC [Alphaproteobacteria bacterium RIFOXYD12_FULL_60_8]